ncbi:MAG: isoprenylcysteine carboxylmethyltransferase family protein [Candidatus Micrarchaeota archaeon]
MKMEADWYWGCLGFLGMLGYSLNEPLYYAFFAFFLFFLRPVFRKGVKGGGKMPAGEKVDRAALKRKALVRFGLAPFALGALFFIPAGSLCYWQAWLYMAVLLVPMAFVVAYFLKRDPMLLERRLRMKEKVTEQETLVKFSYLWFVAAFIVPGLDYRFGLSQVPVEVVLLSNLLVLIGYFMFFLVMKENSFLSRIVEVQKGQKVISTGPYAVVRHPMYTAVLIIYGLSPLALGSYWGFLAVLPLMGVLYFRTLNEEKVLLRGLKGYKEYCRKVRWRMVPFVW